MEKNLLIGCIYRPHCNTNYDDLINILTDITVNFTDVILAGDFNSDILRESTLTSNMESLGLKPVNLSFLTHFSRTRNTLLDWFFVSVSYDQLIVPSFSKHDLIYLTYNFDLNYTDHIISYRDFKNINYILLNEAFDQCVWNNIYSLPTVDRQLNFLQLNISTYTIVLFQLKVKQFYRPKNHGLPII